MKRTATGLAILIILTATAAAPPPPPPHHAWLPWAFHQPAPCAEKRRPQPHHVTAAEAILQPADLPEHDLDPALSGDALSDQLRGMGAADAYKTMFWARDWSTSPLTVYNIVVVFWDEDSARGYMRYLADKCVELGGTPVTVPPLADDANACRRSGGMNDVYTVNQCHGNVVSGTGADGTLATALEVAALSLARVECACGGGIK